eukprot:CAMPEP_0194131720 /NCGR_PEP_ID=MMETSP0152-20130528/2427_1 /TAXON_ID=1049557 /ORGANISM="Thalassiothrix antarctica, Strain L6-D1" /LENGTH=306 /DNA_ID=CAMNT_0038826589 /DNA_START=92 /DNA_END=1012 /DNA_ORIENTATION=+
MAIVRRSPRIACNEMKARSKLRMASLLAKRILALKKRSSGRIVLRKSRKTSSSKKTAIQVKQEIIRRKRKSVSPVKNQIDRKKVKSSAISKGSNSNSIGVVDVSLGIKGGAIETIDGEPCDVMLALVDPSKNMDKFYLLQLINIRKTNEYKVFSRWGRTGTQGQSHVDNFSKRKEAVDHFMQKFKEKTGGTGLTWKSKNNPTSGNKYYRFVKQNFISRNAGYKDGKWQYWVDDGVDGKRVGWYDYTEEGSTQTERLYQEHQSNERLGQRLVQSGYFTYSVNLQKMTQTNITHSNHTTRRIQRCSKH